MNWLFDSVLDCDAPCDVDYHQNWYVHLEIGFDCVDCAWVVVNCVDAVVIVMLNDFESVANDLDRRVNGIYLNVDISNFPAMVISTNDLETFETVLANVLAIFLVFV